MAIVKVNFFSESLKRSVNFMAVIPIDKREMDGEGLRSKDEPLKTLYLLHGIYGGEYDWLTSTRIFKWAKDRNLAVILPAGENSFYSDNGYNFYGTFVGDELVRFTRSMFHLSEKREDTFVGGLSMGALGAFYSALRYPDTFGYVGALSVATLADNYPEGEGSFTGLLDRRSYYEAVFGKEDSFKDSKYDYNRLALDLVKSGKPLPKIFMAVGKDDPLLKNSRDYHEMLVNAGFPVDYREDAGAHDWAFWDRNLYRFLEWLPVERHPENKIYDF
ncbi:MAG: alpha/beta hydrolase [Oliverpabstia sp.]